MGGSLFARARAYAPLTPAERALLRLIEGWALAGALAALVAVVQYLAAMADPTRINWQITAEVAAVGFAVGGLLAMAKYFKAQGDPLLASVLQSAAQEVEHAAPPPAA